MARAKSSIPSGMLVKVRVLQDCHLGKCNDVAEVDGAALDGLEGVADANPEAIAYAETLKKE